MIYIYMIYIYISYIYIYICISYYRKLSEIHRNLKDSERKVLRMFGKLGDIWRQCGDGPGMGSPGPSPGLSQRLWLSHQQGCVKPETSQRDET